MKLLYITPARIPTEKAHGLQIIKMCEAFQHQGIEIKLFVPTRAQSPVMQQITNLWHYYEVDTTFPLRYIATPDVLWLQKFLPDRIMNYCYAFQCLVFSLFAMMLTMREQQSFYYTRALQTIVLLCLTKRLHRKQIYFEAHEFHGDHTQKTLGRKILTGMVRWMLCRIDGLVVLTQHLKTLYTELGMDAHRIFVAPDAVDAKRLSLSLTQAAARQKLHIPLDKKVVCYTGHLFQWKGVHILAESVKYLPEDCLIYIVGGVAAEVVALQRLITEQHLNNIVVTGYVPYGTVPFYLKAADVLVLPNISTAKISREYTSPLKLFEYMGVRRPIVASDLPSFREVLRHQDNAYLVQPDSPEKLAEGIMQVLQDETLAERMAETAYAEVQEYTWDKRAQKIIVFLQQNGACAINDSKTF